VTDRERDSSEKGKSEQPEAVGYREYCRFLCLNRFSESKAASLSSHFVSKKRYSYKIENNQKKRKTKKEKERGREKKDESCHHLKECDQTAMCSDGFRVC
jgi:hypothetical protein